MKRRLLLNTGSNYVVFVMQMAVAFIMTPLYVRYLGLRDFGLWEVVVSIIGYAGMLDLGLWPTVSRFVAKYQAEGDREGQESTFATALVFLSLIGIVGAIATVCVVVLLERELFFGESPDVVYYRWFLLLLGLRVILKFPGIVAEAYLEGQQRYFLKNIFSIVNLLVSTSIVYALIDDTHGLLLLVSVGLATMSFKYGIFFWLLFHSQPQEFSLRLAAYSRSHLRVLLRFGLKSFVQGLSARLSAQSSPLIIATVASTALVPLYTIPASLVRYAKTFLMTSTHAFMPLFTELSSSGQVDRIRYIYLICNKAVAGAGTLMLLGVALVGPAFVAVWISEEVAAHSQWILAFLCLGGIATCFDPFGSRFLTAIDKHGIYAKYLPVIAVVTIALGIVLMFFFGLPGLAAGYAIPALIALPLFSSVVCRNLGVRLGRYFLSFIPEVACGSLFSTAVWLIQSRFFGTPDDYLHILLTAVVMTLAYAVAFLTVDFVRPENVSVSRKLLAFRARQRDTLGKTLSP